MLKLIRKLLARTYRHYRVCVVANGGAADVRYAYAASERQARRLANRNGDVAQVCRVEILK